MTIGRKKMIRKKRYLRAKAGASIGMKIGKGIDSFIKNDIPRDVNSSYSNIKALKSFVHVTITKEHTLLGSILEFYIIVRA